MKGSTPASLGSGPGMCHFPITALSYPASARISGKVGLDRSIVIRLFRHPWRLAYMPVRKDPRLGLHSDVVVNAFRNQTPSRASRSMFGVSMNG
jgi:hypothetical protein